MAAPVLTPAEWRAAHARLRHDPEPDAVESAGPALPRRLPARIAAILASLEFRLGGA